MKNKTDLSYSAHKKQTESLLDEKEERLFTMKNNDCVAYKLNERTLNVTKPFLQTKNTWLTIGDYVGYEASYFLKNNQDVTASNLSDVFLRESAKENLIGKFEAVNVEKIQFEDNSFDYVFCKEAFHHFPRAFLGLYEMMRVSKKAVIFVEPLDIISKMPLLLFFKNFLDRFNPLLINKIWRNRFSFEKVGNYVFKISERDVEKMAMGIGLPCIAFKPMNILFVRGKDKRLNETPINQAFYKKLKNKTVRKNIISKLGFLPYNHLYSVIFKERPEEKVLTEMKKNGFKIIDLPKNPYL